MATPGPWGPPPGPALPPQAPQPAAHPYGSGHPPAGPYGVQPGMPDHRPWYARKRVILPVTGCAGFLSLACVGGLLWAALLAGVAPVAGDPIALPATRPSIVATPWVPRHTMPPPRVPEPIVNRSLRGKGTGSVPLGVPAGRYLADLTYTGSGNFIVHAVDSSGQEIDLLVNEIGKYDGTVLVEPTWTGRSPVRLKVTATGPWTIALKPLASARRWDGTGPLSGRGPEVVDVGGSLGAGRQPVRITHKGPSNFVVEAHDGKQRDLLVNDIGSYTGEHFLDSRARLLLITAQGNWTVRKL